MPDWTDEIRRRLHGARLDGATEADVVEELSQHADDRYRELIADGVEPLAAHQATLAELADDGALAARIRATRRPAAPESVPVGGTWGHGWLGVLLGDVRHAVRLLTRSPAYTLVAVVIMGLGIGATTTVYSVIHSVLLRPTPGVVAPDELVVIHTSDFSGPRFSLSSYPDVEAMREATDAFSGVAAYAPRPFSVSGGGRAERLLGELVTANYFELLGLQPRLGRFFLPDEGGADGTANSVVISSGLWASWFGGRDDVIGSSLRVNGQVMTVAGVAPPDFRGSLSGFAMDVWIPLSAPHMIVGFDPGRRGTRGLFVVARLLPGVTVQGAQTRLDAVAAQLHAAHPDAWTDMRQQSRALTVVPQAEARVPRMMRGALLGFFALLAGVVSIVLLITCANVANLTLARAASRQGELGIRLALGATRRRLVAQLLTESVLLSLLGGTAGVLIAVWAVRVLNAVRLPLPAPLLLDAAIDTSVLLFAALTTLATGVIFGLAPALQASRPPAPMMRGVRGGDRAHMRLRNGLVVAQMAASLVLLVGGGLFLRSLVASQRMDPGFSAENMVLVPFDLRAEGYSSDRGAQFVEELLTRVSALPGVQGATVAERVPLGVNWSRIGLHVEGYTQATGEDMEVHYNAVGADYFSLMEIAVLRGRGFRATDRADAPPVVVVNQAFVDRFWPGQDPIGRRVSMSGSEGPWAEVVGLTPDGKYRSLAEAPMPFLYLPYAQAPTLSITLQVRTRIDPAAVVPTVRHAVRSLDPEMPVPEITTLQQQVGLAALPQRIAAVMLAAFGTAALLIAAVGLYGVVAYSVAQRTREFGIRMALGAPASDVRRMVLMHGLRISAIGVLLGLAAAALLAQLVQRLLLVSPMDPVAFVGVPLVLAGAAALASYLPARKATRADPLAALRSE